jgi:hypothetical protein
MSSSSCTTVFVPERSEPAEGGGGAVEASRGGKAGKAPFE